MKRLLVAVVLAGWAWMVVEFVREGLGPDRPALVPCQGTAYRDLTSAERKTALESLDQRERRKFGDDRIAFASIPVREEVFYRKSCWPGSPRGHGLGEVEGRWRR